MSRRTKFRKAVLSALHYSGADSVIAPLTRGIGAIFMLHHVRPEKPSSFEPNRILKVTPDFLEEVIAQVRASGFEIISLDEAQFRMIEGNHGKPFICFTFDDGYRDNLEYAYPIFKRHNLPFAIYVPTDYADGDGDLWWLALEKVIVKVDALSVKLNGVSGSSAAARRPRKMPPSRPSTGGCGPSTRPTRAPSCATFAAAPASIPAASAPI